MDSSKVILIICLTVFLVVGINAALFAALRKGNEIGQIELFRRAAQRARHPWADEDEALQELARRVAALKTNPGETGADLNQAEEDKE